MSLQYPWFLLLLLILPLLVYGRYAGRRKPTAAFSDGAILGRMPTSWAIRLSVVLPILYVAGISLLIIAIARPRKGLDESRVTTDAVDIVLLVDVSPSMEAIDLSDDEHIMNRLEAAKKVLSRFIEERKGDRVGMVAFAAYPFTVSPLTLDHAWLKQQMERLNTRMFQDGSNNLTAIGTGLGYSINRLRDSKAMSKVIILLTDGVNNSGTIQPVNAAQAAQALDIKIYPIGAGASGRVKVPLRDQNGNYVRDRLGRVRVREVFSEIDEETLKKIAEITGTRYFKAEDFDALDGVFQEIDTMEKTEIEVEQYTRFEERFMLFVAFGVILLILEKLLSLTRLGRLP